MTRKTTLYIILGGIFLTNALLAEFIGVKIFSTEALLNIEPVNWKIFGQEVLNLNLTAGVIIWPIVFVTTDLINEYYGKTGVKRISYLTAIFIAYSFLIIYMVTELPPARFWLEINNQTPQGTPFNINYAFSKIFRQGLGIIVGSITAFLLGQLLDAYTFHILRKITGNKRLWIRATGSTVISQLIDSFVVIFIAFKVFGNWNMAQVLSVSILNYTYKVTLAIILTPLLYIVHPVIDAYLGIKAKDEKIQDAG